MKHALPRLIWIFLGLLGVSMLALSLGKNETEVQPSAFSTGPSGIAAFVQLLRNKGYDVRIDHRLKPVVGPRDLVIAAWVESEEFANEAVQKNQNTTFDSIYESIDRGADALFLEFPLNFFTRSVEAYHAQPVGVKELGTSRTLMVKTGPPRFSQGREEKYTDEDATVRVMTMLDGNEFARVVGYGDGTYVWVPDGSFASNRLIDQAQNAEALLKLVDGQLQQGGQIVIAEGASGQVAQVGLLESIGAWADAAWRQLIFLCVVVISTLGKRFGLPEAVRRKQSGGRELVAAISDTLARGKNAKLALTMEVEQAENDIRRQLRLARDAEIELRSERLPTDLRVALAEAKSAVLADRLPPASAIQCIKRLHAALASSGFRR